MLLVPRRLKTVVKSETYKTLPIPGIDFSGGWCIRVINKQIYGVPQYIGLTSDGIGTLLDAIPFCSASTCVKDSLEIKSGITVS